MTAKQNELLSALVDGELQGEELAQVLSLLETSEAAQAQYKRFQATSDSMNGYKSTAMQFDLTQSMAAALEQEPTYSNKPKASAKIIAFPARAWKQVSGLAVAASVGALAVVGVTSQPETQLIPSVQTAAYEVVSDSPQQVSNRWTVEEPEVEERLNTYLVDHHEYAGTAGVFSYARVVSYDSEK